MDFKISSQDSRFFWHQELPFKIQGPLKTFCRLITCIIGSRANDIVRRTRTTCQELQKAAAPERRKTTAREEEDGLSLTSDSFEDQDDKVRRNNDIRAKNNDLERRNKRPNDKVRRNDETELQIAAPIEETAEEVKKRLRRTDESIASATELREKGSFLFNKKGGHLERRQGLLSKRGSFCGPSGEGEDTDPNEFLFRRTRTPTGL